MNFDEFELKIDDLRLRFLPKVGATLRDVIYRELFLDIVANSPVGRYPSDRHPGLFRASNVVASGSANFVSLPQQSVYAVPGAPQVDVVLASTPIGVPIFISNSAQYAAVIEGGRRAGRRGRMVGSEQAREGVYGPAIERLRARATEIEEMAIALMAATA